MPWRPLAAGTILSLALAGSQPIEPKVERTALLATAVEPDIDPYLTDKYRLLRPEQLPDSAEVGRGCDRAMSHAITELEAGGMIIERSYERTGVRKLECRWTSDRPRIAECRFERATIGFGSRMASVASVPESDWKPAAARFALVDWARTTIPRPRWMATHPC